MNRPELVAAVAERTGRSRRDVDEILRGVTDVVTAAVADGEPVAISGFAKFTPVDRPARTGRNPRTGEPVPIPASRRVRVTVLKALKDAVADEAPPVDTTEGAGADGTPDGEGGPVALTSVPSPGDGASSHDAGRAAPEPAPARQGDGAEVAQHASAPEPAAHSRAAAVVSDVERTASGLVRRHGEGVGLAAVGPAPEPHPKAGWFVVGSVALTIAVSVALYFAPFLAEPGVLP